MTTATIPTTIGAYSLDDLLEVADSPKETAALLRKMLRQRTGLRYSVTLGRGTASSHISISAGNVDDISAHRDAYRTIFGRAIGYPIDILVYETCRIRTLAIAAGADHAAEWLDLVAPRPTWDW